MEKIVFSIEFDDKDAEKKLKDLVKASIELKAEKQALEKAFKEGALSADEYAGKLIENTKALSDNAKSTQELKKDIELASNVRKSALGSIEQERIRLAQLTKAYNALSKEERENTEEGRKLAQQIKVTSDGLKRQESAVGDNRRSIGGYKDAIMESVAASGKFGTAITGIGVAFKANPIGLIITAIQLLPQLLNSSGDGADYMAKKFAQVNAVFQEGLKRIVGLGTAAWEFLQGNFKAAADAASAATTGFGESLEKAWNQSGELADRIDALEVAESNFTVTTARTERAIQQLLIQSKNRTLSEAERIKMLEKAEKLERDLNDNAIALAEERLAIEKANNKLKQEDSDEQLKRENELQIAIEELRTKSLAIEEKIQNRKDELADKAHEKAVKRAEELAKLQEAARSKELLSDITRLEEHEGKLVELQNKSLANLEKAAAKGIENKIAWNDKLIAEEQRLANEEARIQQAKIVVAFDVSNALGDIAGAFVENAKTAAGIQKGVALFQIAVDTAMAISSLTKASQQNPLNGPTAGVAGVIQFATGIAQILANIAKAKNLLSSAKEPAPAFAGSGVVPTGYEVPGGDGRGRGDNTLVWAKPGEVILNNHHQRMLGGPATFKRIGVPGFANSGMVTTSDGGLVSRSVSAPVMQSIDYNKLSDAIAALPPPVLHLTELNQKQSQIQRTASISDI